MYNDSHSWITFPTQCSLYYAIRVLIIATDRDLLHTISIVCTEYSGLQGWGQVQLTKYSSTPSTLNIYQVQVLVKYSFF